MRNPYQQQISPRDLQALQSVNLPNPAGYGAGIGGWLTSPDISQGLIGAGDAILNSNAYGGSPVAGIAGFNQGMISSQQRRIDNAVKAANTQAAFARSLRGGSGGNTPAALQLAQAHQQAIADGDLELAQQIEAYAKVNDKGVFSDQNGQFQAAPGYASALSGIAGSKKGAEQNAKNASDLRYAEPTKEAEKIGEAIGVAKGAQEKKIVNAPIIRSTLEEVRKLLPQSTSGGLNTTMKGVRGYFNSTTDSAQTDARLGVLSSVLLNNVPRMEGPQSDADRASYETAAGKVSDTNLPYQERLAAADTIDQLEEKYSQSAIIPSQSSGINQPGGMPRIQKSRMIQSQAVPMQTAGGHKFTVIK